MPIIFNVSFVSTEAFFVLMLEMKWFTVYYKPPPNSVWHSLSLYKLIFDDFGFRSDQDSSRLHAYSWGNSVSHSNHFFGVWSQLEIPSARRSFCTLSFQWTTGLLLLLLPLVGTSTKTFKAGICFSGPYVLDSRCHIISRRAYLYNGHCQHLSLENSQSQLIPRCHGSCVRATEPCNHVSLVLVRWESTYFYNCLLRRK